MFGVYDPVASRVNLLILWFRRPHGTVNKLLVVRFQYLKHFIPTNSTGSTNLLKSRINRRLAGVDMSIFYLLNYGKCGQIKTFVTINKC